MLSFPSEQTGQHKFRCRSLYIDTFYFSFMDKNTRSVCYCTLEVESSRLAVEALDLSNSIKAFSKG